MKTAIIFALLFLSTASFAGEMIPGIVCHQSAESYMLIEPKRKIIRLFSGRKHINTAKIRDTQLRFIEGVPLVAQTKYVIDSGKAVVMEYPSRAKAGTGYILDNDKVVAKYPHCVESEDITPWSSPTPNSRSQ